MNSICFVVPFFGSLPEYTQVWLDTCKVNETVDWILITDDETEYIYPQNVKTVYMTFESVREIVQATYDFKVCLESAYKLVDFKIAYGEIFSKYLKNYDFWGFCDIDLMWGNIRKFYTDTILEKYAKIGCQGHCTIFRNTNEINTVYRDSLPGEMNYRQAFSTKAICCTDIGFIRKRFEARNLAIYSKTVYAGLQANEPAFYLQAMPKEAGANNERQIFTWNNGELLRYYKKGNELVCEEYLYIHFFKRPMKNKIKTMNECILIYPDVYENFGGEVNLNLVCKYGRKSRLLFYYRMLKQNKNKIGLKKIVGFIKSQINPSYK